MQWHKSTGISQIVIALVLRTRAITCDMPLLAIALPYNTRRGLKIKEITAVTETALTI